MGSVFNLCTGKLISASVREEGCCGPQGFCTGPGMLAVLQLRCPSGTGDEVRGRPGPEVGWWKL